MAQSLLSKAECIEVVRNALDVPSDEAVSVQDFVVSPASSDTMGFMGEYFKLKLEAIYNGKHHNLSFFVKSIPITNPFHRKEIEDKGVFKKESFIYTHLLKEFQKFGLPKWHANCYFNRPNNLIVLEDLFHTGFRHVAEGQTLSVQHLEAVLRTMAVLHATSIAYEVKTRINIGEKYGNIMPETQFVPDNPWLVAGLKAIKAAALTHPKFQTEEYKKFIETEFTDAVPAIFELVKTSKEFKSVLCHRDAWVKNLFFKYDSAGSIVDSALVDFQLARYHPPAIDVMFFVHINSTQNFRNKILFQLLSSYYKNLEKNFEILQIPVEERISWTEFERSCESVKPVVLLINALDAPLSYLPSDLVNELKERDPEAFSNCMTVNRDGLILDFAAKNEFFKQIVLESAEELVDYLFRSRKN